MPGECIKVEYKKEYGSDFFELQKDGVTAGQNVVIVDDLLATGGTLEAACQLVRKTGGNVLECLCIVQLPELKGSEKVSAPCWALLDLPAGC